MLQAFQCSAVNSILWQIVPEAKHICEKRTFETFDYGLAVVLLRPVEILVHCT